jgi:hypothetical protein
MRKYTNKQKWTVQSVMEQYKKEIINTWAEELSKAD